MFKKIMLGSMDGDNRRGRPRRESYIMISYPNRSYTRPSDMETNINQSVDTLAQVFFRVFLTLDTIYPRSDLRYRSLLCLQNGSQFTALEAHKINSQIKILPHFHMVGFRASCWWGHTIQQLTRLHNGRCFKSASALASRYKP